MPQPKMPMVKDRKPTKSKPATALTDRYLGRPLGARPIRTSVDQSKERKAARGRTRS